MSDTVYDDVVVSSGKIVKVYEDETYLNTTVQASGQLHVDKGGTVVDTIVESKGTLYVYAGGTAKGSEIGNAVVRGEEPEIRYGKPWKRDGIIKNYGTVSNLTIEAYGSLECYSGSINENIVVKRNGAIKVSGASVFNNVTISDGAPSAAADYQLTVTGGGKASNVVLKNQGTAGINDGGIDVNATIDGGYQYVNAGALAQKTLIKSGSQTISGSSLEKNGTAEEAVLQGGSQIIEEFGVAVKTTVEGGVQLVKGGTAQAGFIKVGGKMDVQSGVAYENTIAGMQTVGSGKVVESGKTQEILDNVTAVSIGDVIAEGGSQVVNAGGAVQDVTLDKGATLTIEAQGVLDGELNAGLGGSKAYFNSGAIIAGKFATMGEIFLQENVTFADDTAGLYLWVDALNTSSIDGVAMLHDFSLLCDNVDHCFISVSGGVASNTYALADGAGDFDGTIGIYNEDWYNAYGSLKVNGETVVSNYVEYTLRNEDGTLYVDIVNNTIYDEKLDLQGNGKISSATFETVYAGRYMLQDFINAANFYGTVDIHDKNGKKIVSMKVSNGKIVDEKKNDFLLEAGKYTITCTAQSAGAFTQDAKAHVVHNNVFFRANQFADDNFYELNEDALRIDAVADEKGKVEVLVSEKNEYYEYVGYQDLKDYRQINIASDGIYSIDLTKTTGTKTALRATLYQVKGTALKKVAAVTLKDAAETGKLFTDKQLAAGTYYIMFESTGGKSGYATTYGAVLSGAVLKKADDGSHAALTTDLKAFEDKKTAMQDTVNFASPEIYYSWSVEKDGMYTLSALADVVSSVGNNALTITVWNTLDGKTAMNKVLSFSTKNVKLNTEYTSKAVFMTGGEYFISVKSAQTAKGAQVIFTLTEECVKEYPDVKASVNNFADAQTVTVNTKNANICQEVYAGYDDAIEWINLDLGGDVVAGGKFNFTVSNSSIANGKATVSIYQLLDGNKLKKLKGVSVAAGKSVEIKNLALADDGVYFIQIDGTAAGKSKQFAEISVSVSASQVNNGSAGSDITPSDNQIWLLPDEYCMTVHEGQTAAFEKETLSGNDSVDYRKITLENGGYCNFELTSSDLNANLTATVYKWNAAGTALTKVTSVTLKSNAKDPSVALKKDLLMDAGEYYIEVKCANTAKGGYGKYDLTVNMSQEFDHADMKNSDDNYAAAAELSLADVKNNEDILQNGYVGYGDTIDFIKLEDVQSGSYEFEIKANGKTTFTLYRYDEKSNKLVSLVSKNFSGNGELAAQHLEADVEYYLAVKTSDTKNAITYELEADAKLAKSINAEYDKDACVELEAMYRQNTALVNFAVGAQDAGWKYVFEDSNLGSMTLYMYNESNGKLKKISYKAGKEIALAEGSYYLELKTDMNCDATYLSFDCESRSFAWEKTAPVDENGLLA